MKLKYLFFLFIILTGCCVQGQQAEKLIREGNDLYHQQQYEKANTAYRKALITDPAGFTAKYNLAISLYRQHQHNEAIKDFDEAVVAATENISRSQAYYNKGAVYSLQQKTEESIAAYQNALRQNPADKEARENLQKAMLELKMKKQPPPDKKNPQKQNQRPQKTPLSKMNPREAEQRLRLLEQKEKEVQQRMQKEKAKTGGKQSKDW